MQQSVVRDKGATARREVPAHQAPEPCSKHPMALGCDETGHDVKRNTPAGASLATALRNNAEDGVSHDV